MTVKTLSYVITTNDNIRCYGCADDCEKFRAEHYVDTQIFQEHMNVLQRITPSLATLKFVGGEPLLNKELVDLCEIAHKTFPNLRIQIYTNGILLNTIKDNQLIHLSQNCNVDFFLYLYPIHTYMKTYKKQISRFANLNIPLNWDHSHQFFNKHTLSRSGKTCLQELNDVSFIIQKDSIYPLCHCLQTILPKLYKNLPSLQVVSLQSEDQLNSLVSDINICKMCNNTHPLTNLYIEQYEQYESLTNYVYDLGAFLQEPLFFENIQFHCSKNEFQSLLTRCVNGWLDVYIPFHKDELNPNMVKEALLAQQGIEHYNLYFVSIDDDVVTQYEWFSAFSEPDAKKLNVYFLKGSSLYLGVKTFFNNSRIVNKYFLDTTNLQLLKNPTFFFNIANKRR